jgi:hypothetical protein
LRLWLASKTPGSLVFLKVWVRHKSLTPGFVQFLSLPLRVAGQVAPLLPLRPAFLHFEDPEYNRRLASLAGQKSRILMIPDADENLAAHTITLATDRREYNVDSELFLRYDWDVDPGISEIKLYLKRLEPNGVTTNVSLTGDDQPLALPSAATLHRISLQDLRRVNLPEGAADSPVLQPGQGLELTLKVPIVYPGNPEPVQEPIVLVVNLVEEPVIPTPKAAYGLLRWQTAAQGQPVSCERFAWGPAAGRVDLICAEDLREEVVRRRAVFQWTDSVRAGDSLDYAVQKIAHNGATHFPAKNTNGNDAP